MNENFHILIVEDEEDLNEILKFNLESDGYIVDSVFSAEEALRKNLSSYHLLILDVMLGKISGFSLAQRIRKSLGLETPIIFLTAKTTETDILTGFNLGADDYITKPFSIRELQARVKVVIKRSNTVQTDEELSSLTIGDMTIDSETKRLIIGDKRIELTRKEFEIISLLARYPGRIFSREEILRKIWGSDVIVNDRTVDVNITRLRRKMKDYGSYINNKAGFGYFFEINA